MYESLGGVAVYECAMSCLCLSCVCITIVLSLYWYFPPSLFLSRFLINFPITRDSGGGDKHLYYGFAHGFGRDPIGFRHGWNLGSKNEEMGISLPE
jgi:hypothetical protein